MKVVQRKTDGTVQLASKQLKGHICPARIWKLIVCYNTQTCFITTQTETAAAAVSHMNTVMCTLNHAQDKRTQFSLYTAVMLHHSIYLIPLINRASDGGGTGTGLSIIRYMVLF